MERILFKKTYEFLTRNNLLTWHNSVYKKDSTTNRLILIVNDIHQNLDHRQDSCLVFLDQSKVLDRIHYQSLMKKLQAKGIDGKLLQLMNSYLINRKIWVILNGAKSNWFNVNAGVPQGSILGPLLFLIYADDLVEDLECDIHLYADNAVIMVNYQNSITAFSQVNRDLERLNEWANKWHMSFNLEKTKYMVITTVDKPHPSLQLNRIKIEQVHSYPQLGLILNDHINDAITKANKKIGLIWRLNSELPIYAVENIYNHI